MNKEVKDYVSNSNERSSSKLIAKVKRKFNVDITSEQIRQCKRNSGYYDVKKDVAISKGLSVHGLVLKSNVNDLKITLSDNPVDLRIKVILEKILFDLMLDKHHNLSKYKLELQRIREVVVSENKKSKYRYSMYLYR